MKIIQIVRCIYQNFVKDDVYYFEILNVQSWISKGK